MKIKDIKKAMKELNDSEFSLLSCIYRETTSVNQNFNKERDSLLDKGLISIAYEHYLGLEYSSFIYPCTNYLIVWHHECVNRVNKLLELEDNNNESTES